MTDAAAPSMALGLASEAGASEASVELNWLQRWAAWQFRTRRGLVCLWLVCALAGVAGVAYWHFYREPILGNDDTRAFCAAAGVLVLLPLLLLLLESRNDLSTGPKPGLSLATLVSLAALAGLAYADQQSGGRFLHGGGRASEILLAGFLVYLLAVFIPRIWSASDFAKYDGERRTQRAAELAAQAAAKAESEAAALGRVVAPDPPIEDTLNTAETRDAEAMGALIATLSVLGIGALAYAAGDGAALSLQSRFGLLLCFAVIAVFAVVVFLDAFAEMGPVRSLAGAFEWVARRNYWLASFYNWIDAVLVRIGAHIAGMGHRNLVMRYIVLVATLGALCVMGWYLPAPYGIAPAFIAFVLAISVSRLWSWVEEDRALAAMTEYRTTAPYRMDFREDFRDETLLGFIFVFLIAPVVMMQAHNGGVFGPHLFANADGRDFGEWFGFFGIELAKAIPIVDWAEIYGVQTSTDMIAINGAASRHAVFLARVLVDLVLIASLAQAIGIWTRNRQQKELYRNRHIERLDPFVERVELARAIRGAQVSEADGAFEFDLMRLRSDAFVDFRRYLESQLRQIYGSTREASTRAFIEAIAKQRYMALAHPIDLAVEAAEGAKDEEILFRTFHLAIEEHDAHVEHIEPGDLFRILSGLRTTQGLQAFKREGVNVLCRIAPPEQAIDILSGLAGGEKGDRFLYARDHMIRAMGDLTRRMDDPAAVQAVRKEIKRIQRLRSAPKASAARAALRTVDANLRRLGVRIRRSHDEED